MALTYPPRPTIVDARCIQVSGQLDYRLRAAVARLAADDVFDEMFVLQDVARVPGYRRQFEDWAGDLSGRYIGALAASAAYTGERYPRLDSIAHAIPRFQRASGLVGSDLSLEAIDFPVVWGHGRLLAGLLEYHAVFPSNDILECARRIGDYYMSSAPAWQAPKTRAEPDFPYVTQAIEGLVRLHQQTQQESYLVTARAMGMLFLTPDHSLPTLDGHSHARLLTLLGLLDLFESTREDAFLHAARDAAARLSAGMVFTDGAPPEFFPWSARNEGCSIADWLELNLRLGVLTGEANYFETAETVWRNALYGNQAANGGFCHRNFRPDRRGYTGEGSEAWWCCSYHGLRGYCRLMRYLYSWAEDEVRVHFLEPSTVELRLPDGRARIAQQTTFPGRGEASFRILEAPPGGVRLLVRLPRWSSGARVQLNGAPTSHFTQDTYLGLSEPLVSGSQLTITFQIGLRLKSTYGMLGSLWYGSLLLTYDMPGGTPHAVAVPGGDRDGRIRLPRLDPPHHAYAVAGAHFAVVATGAPVSQPVESLVLNQPQLGRLRPFAEQTALAAPPPAVLEQPVIVATSAILKTELDRLLVTSTYRGGSPPSAGAPGMMPSTSP